MVVGSTLFVQGSHEQYLQVIHIKERAHWIALQIINSEICLYDSLFASASSKILQIIAQLVKVSFNVNIMNMNRQVGLSDYGLYAIAAVTYMLLNEDPTAVVLDQGALGLHLVKILEANIVSSFPIVKTR